VAGSIKRKIVFRFFALLAFALAVLLVLSPVLICGPVGRALNIGPGGLLTAFDVAGFCKAARAEPEAAPAPPPATPK
jgi:hypothetical protein